MNRKNIKKIIDQNPHVDKKSLEDGIGLIKKLRNAGVSRSRFDPNLPYSKKARLIDDRDELRCGRVSFQQY